MAGIRMYGIELTAEIELTADALVRRPRVKTLSHVYSLTTWETAAPLDIMTLNNENLTQ